jgi:hypothetical protein
MESATTKFYRSVEFQTSKTPQLFIPVYAKTDFEDKKTVPTKLSKMSSLAIIAQSDKVKVRR